MVANATVTLSAGSTLAVERASSSCADAVLHLQLTRQAESVGAPGSARLEPASQPATMEEGGEFATETDLKACPGCQRVKPMSQFHRNRTKPDLHASDCKTCANAGVQRKRKLKRFLVSGGALDGGYADGAYDDPPFARVNHGSAGSGDHQYLASYGNDTVNGRRDALSDHTEDGRSGGGGGDSSMQRSQSLGVPLKRRQAAAGDADAAFMAQPALGAAGQYQLNLSQLSQLPPGAHARSLSHGGLATLGSNTPHIGPGGEWTFNGNVNASQSSPLLQELMKMQGLQGSHPGGDVPVSAAAVALSDVGRAGEGGAAGARSVGFLPFSQAGQQQQLLQLQQQHQLQMQQQLLAAGAAPAPGATATNPFSGVQQPLPGTANTTAAGRDGATGNEAALLLAHSLLAASQNSAGGRLVLPNAFQRAGSDQLPPLPAAAGS
eukprot:CAMPEP_0206147818 /NCGR_PEP_ID=MMETSP1473-20131121/34649_1 /ASSEMBLY_ACC=CAM_ASM_001109 /TAXON_ID=1461547 /ORGANISM="Stichococcus sp, Strain RCC1054" /LENGTH=435 /DNA_ID=CAMNT_0053544909 /DNA_START=153 /DNA_END=1457 /DNA_ORIENTATION=+